MLYIIKKDYFLADYILAAFDGRTDIAVIPYTRNKYHGAKHLVHLLVRFLRAFVCNRKGWWTAWFYPPEFLRQLQAIGEHDKVLLWGCENLKELLVLNKELACHEKSVFLWNPVATICRNRYSRWEYGFYLNRSGMRVCTFDEGDAKAFHFEKVNQVYRREQAPSAPQEAGSRTEALFIGKDKRRSAMIAELRRAFVAQGIAYDFYIIRDKHTHELPELRPYYRDQEMTYEASLAMVRQADCLIELMQKGQTGMTLRALEAVFLQKKLITTNQYILHSPIYHPNNIYVLGMPNTHQSMREFLDADYAEYPDEVTRPFQIEHWIEKFL